MQQMTDDEAAPLCWRIERASPAEAVHAVDILTEAARWTSRFGAPIWGPDTFAVRDYQAFAAAGELIGGFDGDAMVACMLLQARDDLFWPDDPPHSALYLHKVAVRRAAAGRGWLGRLVAWAVAQARERDIGILRLDTLPSGRLPGLYGALGFHAVDGEPRSYAGRLALRMERRL
jgi:ribosomal protein S18 acetylase RimI-like enzyme